MDAAEPGTTLVSGTTRELTIGAGLEFADRGIRAFNGVSGERPVYEARLLRPVGETDERRACSRVTKQDRAVGRRHDVRKAGYRAGCAPAVRPPRLRHPQATTSSLRSAPPLCGVRRGRTEASTPSWRCHAFRMTRPHLATAAGPGPSRRRLEPPAAHPACTLAAADHRRLMGPAAMASRASRPTRRRLRRSRASRR